MKLGLVGIRGRMGQEIAAQALQGAAFDEVIAISRDRHTPLPHPLTSVALHDSLDALAQANVIIDFTHPDYAMDVAAAAVQYARPLVSGTTGFSAAQWDTLQQHSAAIPLFWASNMSVGVALLMQLVTQAAAALDDSYDIEILEMHHRHKVDAPSGTALSLGKAAAEGRKVTFDQVARLSREGQTGARPRGEIGFATLRGGQVIGDHAVLFAGEHDIIELTHRSQSRSIYAQGALKAAQWLVNQPAGWYGMRDLLHMPAP